jgi:hypothetical protein
MYVAGDYPRVIYASRFDTWASVFLRVRNNTGPEHPVTNKSVTALTNDLTMLTYIEWKYDRGSDRKDNLMLKGIITELQDMKNVECEAGSSDPKWMRFHRVVDDIAHHRIPKETVVTPRGGMLSS